MAVRNVTATPGNRVFDSVRILGAVQPREAAQSRRHMAAAQGATILDPPPVNGNRAGDQR
jgi:hypothetical protein